MSAKLYSRGGQKRTITLPCGQNIVGHPVETNKKVKIHRRHCKECLSLSCMKEYTAQIPEFNKTAGMMNGWNGICKNGAKPNEMMTTSCYDGLIEEMIVKANNITDATKMAKMLIGDRDAPQHIFNKDMREKHLIIEELLNYYKDCVEANIELRCWKNYTKEDLQQMPLRKLQIIEEIIHQEIENLVKDEYADDEDFAEFLEKSKEKNIIIHIDI